MDKKRIYESVIEESKKNLLSKISTKNVASNSGISEAYLFKTYKTKSNLLVETFMYIDKMFAEAGYVELGERKPMDSEGFSEFAKEQWLKFLNFFIKNPSYLIFYAAFVNSDTLYKGELIEKQNETHQLTIDAIIEADDRYHIFRHTSPKVYFGYILDVTLSVAKRILNGKLPENDDAYDAIFHIAFDGLFNKMGMLKGTSN